MPEEVIHVLKHAFFDSLKVFALAFIIYIILSFFEGKITKLLSKHKKINPILGSTVGLIPQCGISVVAADMYVKNHITMGTLIAVFFACSDEALPILFSDGDKIGYAFLLLAIKLIIGFLLGYMVDLFIQKREEAQHNHDDESSHHIGCCHHHIEDDESKIKSHLVHPLLHSLKIFIYVFIVNIIFGAIIEAVGEDKIISFLSKNEYLSLLFSTLIGLIPNCSSSVIVTELFLLDGIPFAALVSGLCVNSGLGIVYLSKNKKNIKDVIICVSILLIASLVVGYITLFIMKL